MRKKININSKCSHFCNSKHAFIHFIPAPKNGVKQKLPIVLPTVLLILIIISER